MKITEALNRLEELLEELEHLRTPPYENNKLERCTNKVDVIVKDTFGKDSDEYKYFHPPRFTSIPMYPTEEEKQKLEKELYLRDINTYVAGIQKILDKYETLGIEEKPVVQEEKGYLESPIQLFDALKLHPKIIKVSRERFKVGNYTDAIYRAFVELNNFVKSKTGLSEDGKSLMSKVFTVNNPIIKLNELKTQSDKDEQEGFMFLFMGGQVGIRNPKAHENIIQTDPYKTLEYLSLASLLMRRAEEGNL